MRIASEQKDSLKTFKNCLMYDIYTGIIEERKKYFLFFIYIFILCARFYTMHEELGTHLMLEQSLSFGDYLAHILKGMKFYIPHSPELYIPDFTWLLLFLYISFTVNTYPKKDLCGYGQMILIRSQKRSLWWISKCLWSVMSIVLFFTIILFNALLFALISGANTLLPQADIQLYYHQMNIAQLTPMHFFLEVYLIPLFVTLALSLLQMAFTVIFTPILSYTFMVCIYIASIYSSSSRMIGNYLMPMRNHTFNPTSMIFSVNGIRYAAIIILASIIIGYIKFHKLDILNTNTD